jgi:23S rRNA (uracil1939-C5)-methyltransferase
VSEAAIECVHAARCPGCPLIGLPREARLDAKRERLTRALDRFPELGLAAPGVVPAPSEVAYRLRAKLAHDGLGGLGLFTSGEHEVIDVPECRVMAPRVHAAVQALREWLRAEELRVSVLGVDVRDVEGPPSGVLVTLILDRERNDAADRLAAGASAATGALGVAVSSRARRSPRLLGATPVSKVGARAAIDVIGAVRHVATPGAFVQAHRAQAAAVHERIANELRARLGPLRGLRVLELHAGSGAIGLSLAARGAELCLVESQASAADGARRALSLLGARARVIEAPASRALDMLRTELPSPDAVIVDPPRRGLEAALRAALGRLAPRALVYLSCEPTSLARDLDALRGAGLQTTGLFAFDLMPLSAEVETLAVLERAAVPAPRVVHHDATWLVFEREPWRSIAALDDAALGLDSRARRDAAPASGLVVYALEAPAEAEQGWLVGAVGLVPRKGVVRRGAAVRGVAAETRYRRLARLGRASLAWVRVVAPSAAQVERHLAWLGHPVLGAAGGHSAANAHFGERHGLDRSFVHGLHVRLPQRAGPPLQLTSALPGDLAAIVDALLDPADRGRIEPTKLRLLGGSEL